MPKMSEWLKYLNEVIFQGVMSFCGQCGANTKKGDAFCRKCGRGIIKKPLAKPSSAPSTDDRKAEVLNELTTLVDRAAEAIKKELLSQIAEIEKGIKTGKFTKEQFEAEVKEIKGRLLTFIET